MIDENAADRVSQKMQKPLRHTTKGPVRILLKNDLASEQDEALIGNAICLAQERLGLSRKLSIVSAYVGSDRAISGRITLSGPEGVIQRVVSGELELQR